MEILIVSIVILNIIGFAAMAADKNRAKAKIRRVPESTLMFFAIVGGSIGVFLGMRICRHKTRHAKFFIGVPIIMVIQIVAVIYCAVNYIK